MEAPAHPGHGEKGYRAYVLGALLAVYSFNFIDRVLIGIVLQPMGRELKLDDFQLGLLGGPAFAILYTILGVPIARYAERTSRANIIAIGFAAWSAMTAACGFAGNFMQMLAARVGVGIGEAACVPPSHSLISDYFPTERRATALGIYSLGIPIGAMLAAIGGGVLAQTFGWRAAFWLLGAPGVVLALIFKLTVKEAPRTGEGVATPSLVEVISALGRKKTFWHATLGASWMAFVGYGTSQFLPAHFMRSYGFSLLNASLLFGLIAGVSTTLGTFLGGVLGDRFGRSRPRLLLELPAIALLIATPLYALSFLAKNPALAIAPVMVAVVLHYLYLAPSFAVLQGLASPRMRATSAALGILVINIIGYGGGPPFVGWLANQIAGAQLAPHAITLDDCKTAVDAAAALCAPAQAYGLRMAMLASVCLLPLPALHFFLAARSWARERVS